LVELLINERVATENLGRFDDEVEERLMEGLDLPGDDERLEREGTKLQGRWLLQWRRRDVDGMPARRLGLYWTFLDKTVHGAKRYDADADWHSVAVASADPPPVPFPVEDARFRAAFSRLIRTDQFEDLRADWFSTAAWITPRLRSMYNFWKALKRQYMSG
jgi:hypothetical protein